MLQAPLPITSARVAGKRQPTCSGGRGLEDMCTAQQSPVPYSSLFRSPMSPHPLLFLLGIAGSTIADGVSIYFQVPIPIPSVQLLPLPPPGQAANTTPLVAAYYPDWAPSSFPPSKIDFDRVDVVDFAFALPDKTFNLTWDDASSSPSLLRELVTAAHSKGKKVKLSLGGWDGSQYFSPAVKTNASRSTFASNILAVYHSFSLDGIDIDWEYPGTAGEQGNIVSPEDTSNLLEFFKLLRKVLPEEAYITATSTDSTFFNSLGNPSVDVSAFAEVLDWVLLMNYDVNGGRTCSFSSFTFTAHSLASFPSPWPQCSPE